MANQVKSTKRVSVNIFQGSIVFLVIVLYPSLASQARIAKKMDTSLRNTMGLNPQARCQQCTATSPEFGSLL